MGYFDRGNAYADRGDRDKAIADYSKAIELNPQFAKACHGRGLAFGKQGEYDKAIASIISNHELAPDYIIPSPFDQRVATQVSRAVADAANRTGVARSWDSEEAVMRHRAR